MYGMSLLQFILIVSSVVFLLFWIDLYKRKRMNILHMIVFIWWSWFVILSAINQNILNQFWQIFGTAKWADVLVYIWLIVLFYFYISLLNNHTKDKYQLTRLTSRQAIYEWYYKEKDNIQNFKNTDYKDNFVFNIRVYNEWVKVWAVIDEIFAAWFRKIVFINDWSQDDTLQVLQAKKAQYPDKIFIILSHIINRWWWAANQTGYNFIKKYWDELKIRWFVGFDSDWQMDIQDMETFVDRIKNEDIRISHLINSKKDITKDKNRPNDLYLWSRFVYGWKAKNIPKTRRVILFISKIVTRLFYWTKVSDPHNWYRVISLSALRKINLTADGMHYANELNEQIKHFKFKYEEVPVHIRYTDYSLGKWQKNSNSIRLAIEMIYRKIFFR